MIWITLGVAALASPAVNAQEARTTADCGPDHSEEAFLALPQSERVAQMTCLQAVAVDSVQPDLPIAVDDLTTVVAVTSNGTIVTYVNRVNVSREEWPADMMPRLSAQMRSSACAASDMAMVIRLGGGYRFVWTDRDGALLGEATVDSC